MRLDFNDNEQLKMFLKRDKDNLLEGMVVEELFYQDIVKKSNWELWISKGWWAIQDPLQRSQYLFFHVSEAPPSESDIRIYNSLLNQGILVVNVRLYNNDLYFLEISKGILKAAIREQDYITENTFLTNYGLSKIKSIHEAKEQYRNLFAQERSISFFEKGNLLKELTLQRYFANYFLTVYFSGFPINLDSFMSTQNESGITVFEVKFKFPDSRDYYGINVGQANLFSWLLDKKIDVYHYIAKNPSYKKQIGIFEVLKTPGLSSNFYWEFKKLDRKELNSKTSTAPEETSIGGESSVNYISIPASKFTKILDFVVAKQLDFLEFQNYPCDKCGEGLKVINGPHSYFLGCPNFRNH